MPQPTVQNELFLRLTNCAKTPAQWANTAGTPMLGEPCWEIHEAQTASGLPYSFRLKIGDGTTSYSNLPYYGDFVTLHTDNNTALSVAVWDGTNSQLNFYKVTETNGIVALEQNPYLRLKAGSKVTISTSTVGGVNVLQINHQEQSAGDITEDTAELTDGGTFKVATQTDSYGHVIKWTTFTLPSIATAIANAIDGLDSSVSSTGNVYVLKSITEANGKLTAKTETQIVGGTNMSVVGTDNAITINHDPINTAAADASSGITSDNSSTVGEKNMDIVTGFKVDAQGHVIHIDKDSSMNLIAADIKAPVRMTDDSIWNFRETGGYNADGTNKSIQEDVAKIPVLKGNTIVWNQQAVINASSGYGLTVTSNGNGGLNISGTVTSLPDTAGRFRLTDNFIFKRDGRKYLIRMLNNSDHKIGLSGYDNESHSFIKYDNNSTDWTGFLYIKITLDEQINISNLYVDFIDLTKLFGSDADICDALGVANLTENANKVLAATNFEKLFPNSYYPYCAGRLVNLGGYGVKMNQLVQNGNFASTDNWTTFPYTTMDVANNECTIGATNSSSTNILIAQSVTSVEGHTYYFGVDIKATAAINAIFGMSDDNGYGGQAMVQKEVSVTTTYARYSLIGRVSDVTKNTKFILRRYTAGTETINVKNFICIDLTEMFGPGSEPTLEEFEVMFQNDYYEYNVGTEMNIFDAIGDKKLGLESTGFNLWDENQMDSWTGVTRTSKGWDMTINNFTAHTYFENKIKSIRQICIYIKSTCAITPISTPSPRFNINYSDGTIDRFNLPIDGTSNYIVSAIGKEVVSVSGDYGQGGNNILTIHQLCINFSDPARNGQYEPYKSDTLDLDWIRNIEYTPDGSSTPEKLFPYGLLSAGSVHDEVTETKAIKRVGAVDLGTLIWAAGYAGYFTAGLENLIKPVPQNNDVPNILSAKYLTSKYNNRPHGTISQISVSPFTHINIIPYDNESYSDYNAFKAAMSGVMLYYELATPIEIPLDQPHNMTYAVADHGTEQQLPESAYSPFNAPFVGTFEYYSNFKDAVLDLINRVNGYTNPVRGKNNSAQTEGKLAEYDSDSTVKSSLYAPSNATIVAGQDGNEYILPSVAALVAYVQNLLASALHYKGTVASWSALPSSGQQTGDLYVFSAVDSSHTPPIGIGDFAIWNGSSWDLIQGTVTVTNNATTLLLNGQTYTIGTVEGVSLTLVTPNLQMSDPTANGNANDMQVITNVSQTNGQLAATKKVIPGASVSQKGVVQLERDIHYSESPDKVPTAGQTWREFSKRNVKAVPISVVPVPAVYNTDLYASYELEASSNSQFTVNNSTFAQVYAANMGGYLFYVNNGVVYAAKMKATDWTKFDDDTAITSAIRAATETMIHVPTCNYKASGKKMKFGGLNPLYGGDYFKSPRWVGAYQMDNDGHSRPGVGSGHSKTMTQFWNLAQAIHHDFGLANYEFHNLINALYQAMFGNLNSESVLSDGNSRSSSSWDKYRDLEHGKADSLADGAFVTGPHCVAAVDGAGVTRYVTKFCGFEDLFGKLWEFRPGIRFYMDNGVRKAVVYDGNIVSNSAQGRIISGVLASASGQYTTEMELGEHWDMLPKTVGGSSTTYYCDGYWASTSGELLIVGSNANYGSQCGLAYCSSYDGFGLASGSLGARLAFYGEPVIVSGAEMVAMMA